MWTLCRSVDCFLPDERHCVGVDGEPVPSALANKPAYPRVPLGSITPDGWLGRQELLQADGMSGWYQALFYPPVNNSRWVGGNLKYMLNYMVTYWLNGNVALAAQLRAAGLHPEHDLAAITDGYLDYIVAAQANTTTGRLGPDACGGQFSKMNAVRSLLLKAETSDDDAYVHRLGASVLAGFREQYECTLAGETSGGIRWPSYIEAIIDFSDAYDPSPSDLGWLLNVSLTWRASGADWQRYYADPAFPGCPFPHAAVPHPTHSGCEGCYYHGVNTAEALKLGAVQWRLFGRRDDATLLLTHLSQLEIYHGKPDGGFGMDEFLAGREPQRGTELCDVVELMYSLEWSFQHVGLPLLGVLDRVEQLAFNALPGTTTADLWQHQYDHQTNAISAGNGVYCGGSNGPDATVYGLQPHYPCCTVNLPQGWPKLAASAVLRDGADGLVIVHLLPLTVRVADLGVVVSIETEYPFGDTATLTVRALNTTSGAPPASLRLAVRVPGWADAATIAIDAGPPTKLANGTLHLWNVDLGASQVATAHIDLHPAMRVELGWGTHAHAGPSSVSYNQSGVAVAVPTADADHDWLVSGGAGLAASKNHSTADAHDLRSGSPGGHGIAIVSHPLNSDAHLLTEVALTYQYAAGYTPAAGKSAKATTLSLALVDAINGSHVAMLYTSPPLGNYSFDAFKGYSPPLMVKRTGLAISWPRSLRVALLFDNRERNVQVPIATLEVSVTWGDKQSGPFTPSDLSSPANNAAAVRRGPLLFALPLEQQRSTLHIPAAGGECERPKGAGCRSSDIEFNPADGVAWNFALVLPRDDPSAGLTWHRTRDAAPKVPFDPDATPVSITVAAQRVAAWQAKPGGKVAEPPPPSPVVCNASAGACADPVTLRLVPFGSTSIRIAAFPWIAATAHAGR